MLLVILATQVILMKKSTFSMSVENATDATIETDLNLEVIFFICGECGRVVLSINFKTCYN